MEEKDFKKILITGGHAGTTAIALIEELIRRDKGNIKYKIYFVGAKSALEGKEIKPIEEYVMPQMGITHLKIKAGKIPRKFTKEAITSFLKIPGGFLEGEKVVKEIKPDVVVSFGGFVSFPVVLSAYAKGIPVIIHEQTVSTGLANRITSLFATKITLSRESSLKYFPKNRSVVIGNPIMTQVAEVEPKKKMGNPPVVYLTGGSRGARRVNAFIKPIIHKILENYYFIHQTGELDFDEFRKIKEVLPSTLKERYELYSTIDPMKVDNIYREADIVIARSGANTVAEVMINKRPTIFIPIPFVTKNEQYENAKFAEKFLMSKILLEGETTPDILYNTINELRDNFSMSVKYHTITSPDINASKKLADIVMDLF